MTEEKDERTPQTTSGDDVEDTQGEILMGGPKPPGGLQGGPKPPFSGDDEDTEGHRMPSSRD
jgi:hypothetical protein